MVKDNTSSLNLQQDTEISLNNYSIERCPHDSDNPYVIANRDIIRNASMSPNAKWLLIYMLTFDRSWKFSKAYIMKHQNLKKDALNTMFNELINAGHIKEEKYKVKGLKRVKYLISELPRFKIIHTNADSPQSFSPQSFQPTTVESASKNNKKDKNNKNKESKSHSPSLEVQELVRFFIECLRKNKPDVKIPDRLLNWNEAIRKMLEIDKRTFEKIERVIEWCTTDSFWKANILSPGKLREKFDQLEIKMDSEFKSQSHEVNALEQNRSDAFELGILYPNRIKRREVEILNSYIEFKLGGQSPSIQIEYDDKNFKKLLQSALLRWGNHD